MFRILTDFGVVTTDRLSPVVTNIWSNTVVGVSFASLSHKGGIDLTEKSGDVSSKTLSTNIA